MGFDEPFVIPEGNLFFHFDASFRQQYPQVP